MGCSTTYSTTTQSSIRCPYIAAATFKLSGLVRLDQLYWVSISSLIVIINYPCIKLKHLYNKSQNSSIRLCEYLPIKLTTLVYFLGIFVND